MIPVSIDIKNFFSHRDSFIDFTTFDSALLIGNVDGDYNVSNGSGKSAIFEAVLWALFNKSRAASMDDIIFWGENVCNVIMIFRHGDDEFKIDRKRSRVTSASLVTFFKKDKNDVWVDISGSTSSLTNEEIVKIIKIDYNTFVNSSYFRQNDISEFAESDPSGRKSILKSIIDLSKWDDYERIAKDKLKETRMESRLLQSKIEEYKNVEEDLKSNTENLDSVSERLSRLEAERKNKKEYLQNLEVKYYALKNTLDTDSWDKVTQDLSRFKTSLSESRIKLKNRADISEELTRNIESYREAIAKINSDLEGLDFDQSVFEKIPKLETESMEFKTNLSIAKSKLSELKDHNIQQGQCYTCSQDIDEELYNKLKTDHEDRIRENERIIIYCKNKLLEIDSKISLLKKIEHNNLLKVRGEEKIESLKLNIKGAENRMEETAPGLKEAADSIESLMVEIESCTKILDSLKNDDFKSLYKDIVNERGIISNLDKESESLNREVGVTTEKISSLKLKIGEYKVINAEYRDKLNECVVLERLVKMLGKNGVQTILLNAVIEDLEKTANSILSSICNEPFIIYLDTQRTGADGVSIVDTLDLRVRKDGFIQNFKSLSGGEQFRISIALRIALSEISSRHGGSSLDFLLLDEINSPLDKQGTESLFVNVIKSLEKKYKILVITHNDSLKEKFSDIIDVTKNNGESSLNYISV